MSRPISDERARLRMLRNVLGQSSARVSRIGVKEMDDAALVPLSDSESLVIASDFVRGSEFYLFQLGHMNYFDVGYYLVVANISDIAAMGAQPTGLTTIVRYSKDMTDDDFCLVFSGIAAAADQLGVEIVGGDIGGYRSDVFAATAFGFVETSKALLRSSARAGDLLCVTGSIGLPITALIYFKEMKPRGFRVAPSDEERLLASWRRPAARVKHGLILGREELAHACQDVSDGLKATIEQVGVASGVTFNRSTPESVADPVKMRMPK
jgi:thiamine-monophosphate kinase